MMLSVAAAQAVILEHARPLPAEIMPLTPAVLGLMLAEDVASDLDMPPYDKALMDGYAVRSGDVPEGTATLTVVEEITAGRVAQKSLSAGEAAAIMTGAPMPQGADAVVMKERAEPAGDGRVRVVDHVQPGQNVLPRGREMRLGDVLLPAGTVLRPQELGLLATVGRTAARLHPAPEVPVLPTGDEVVEPAMRPALGQIRNSNGPMLAAQVARAGGRPKLLGIARDRLESLRPLIAEGLRSAVLILSGGVSAGKLDLVPGVLQELGVAAHFHKVEMKPGKPAFFGTRGSTLVFGLPGNPVSSLVCFELFVRPAIRRLRGHADAAPRLVQAALGDDFAYHTDRPTYHPAHLEMCETGWWVRPVPWFGSSDLRGLLAANAFVLFPAGDNHHRKGEVFSVLRVDSDAVL